MPAPLEDLNRDHQCHFYQAPSGQQCGSPALKGEYYCYHHHIKHAKRNQHRVLIDPEVTRMEIPPIEDRAAIFIALAAVVHRLAENTIDTRRAGQMIYGLQVALQALGPIPAPAADHQPAANHQSTADHPNNCRHPERAQRVVGPRGTAPAYTVDSPQPVAPPAPRTIPITKEGLVYFLRSRHCASCNAELFPAEELTERRNPGAPPEIIEEARPALPAPESQPIILPSLHAGCPVTPLGRDTATLAPPTTENEYRPTVNRSAIMGGEPSPNSTFISRFALHSPRRSVSLRLVHMAPHIPASRTARPHRNSNQKANRRKKWQQLMKK